MQNIIKNLLDRLAAIVQRKPMPASAQNSESLAPQQLPQNVTYDRFNTKIDGTDALIEVTLDYQEAAPLGSHPDLLEVIIRLNSPDASGLPTPGEEQSLRDLRQAFLDVINGSLYVGSVTSAGLQNAYIYVPAGASVPDSIRTLNTTLQFSYEIRPDNGWQYYRELMPTLEEGERIANEKQIETLVNRGTSIGQPQVLQHVVVGGTSQLTLLQQRLIAAGYQVEGISNSAEPDKNELVFSKLSNLDLAGITAETTELTRLAGENQSVYVGWDVVESSLPSTALPTNNIAPLAAQLPTEPTPAVQPIIPTPIESTTPVAAVTPAPVAPMSEMNTPMVEPSLPQTPEPAVTPMATEPVPAAIEVEPAMAIINEVPAVEPIAEPQTSSTPVVELPTLPPTIEINSVAENLEKPAIPPVEFNGDNISGMESPAVAEPVSSPSPSTPEQAIISAEEMPELAPEGAAAPTIEPVSAPTDMPMEPSVTQPMAMPTEVNNRPEPTFMPGPALGSSNATPTNNMMSQPQPTAMPIVEPVAAPVNSAPMANSADSNVPSGAGGLVTNLGTATPEQTPQ